MGILDGASAAVGGVGRGSAGSRTSGAARLLSSGWALPAAAAAALLLLAMTKNMAQRRRRKRSGRRRSTS